ncbi:helix-turn-helix domain-containing protein [Aquimarina agarivorans]|uniref:helix-turn-helix domain-containing protein n=1 Tax=Aquimarina agarivorans TaxID=980584 RepID=UPI000248F88A|nr:helix-turn-helix transcriptional regulator [Aquimarina agarivorans]
MINSKEFTFRLQKILSHYELSASAFAEKMGVGRSSISHIISGRNKPSLEFVLHILENFEAVTFDWLMYGKGNFPKTDQTAPDLFSEKEKNIENITTVNKPVKNNSEDLFSNTSNISNEEKLKESNNTTPPIKSSIERIVIFYTNGSFKEYKN